MCCMCELDAISMCCICEVDAILKSYNCNVEALSKLCTHETNFILKYRSCEMEAISECCMCEGRILLFLGRGYLKSYIKVCYLGELRVNTQHENAGYEQKLLAHNNLLIYQARESSLVPAGFLTAQFLQKL